MCGGRAEMGWVRTVGDVGEIPGGVLLSEVEDGGDWVC